ncbi:50S ribosomal protein L29 [Patescibacteria group bacterium]|nr:50S ribosomal protein L29 [Patescibacteria group bacterium]
MKKSDKIVYQQKTLPELKKEIVSLQKQLIEAKIKQGSGQMKDTSLFKKIKYQIALMLTLISQKKNEPKK